MSFAETFRAAAASRILIKDGPYGTAIQRARLSEAEFRGDTGLTRDQKGNNDLVNLTAPTVVRAIADSYVAAGADILATNTFNANRVSQADYGAEALVPEINRAAAAVIRAAANEAQARDGRPRFVVGALGPTNKTLSLSPDVNDPGYREVDWDALFACYHEQAAALIAGGVDALLIETVFDTLNAKCAGAAAHQAACDAGREVPLMLSFTVTDRAGRNLSGHTIGAFWNSVAHLQPLTIGLNCSFGADALRPFLVELSRAADTLILAYPNAGLPNELGEYDEPAEETARQVRAWAEEGLINAVGGCCGTTPDHIAAIAAAVQGLAPRRAPQLAPAMRLAGIEPFVMAA